MASCNDGSTISPRCHPQTTPLQLLQLHMEECNGALTEDESGTCLDEDCQVTEQPVPRIGGMGETSEVCPICLVSDPVNILPAHASTCGDGLDTAHYSEAACLTREEGLPGPSVSQHFFLQAAFTTLFEGEREHWVPSAAAVLRESNLFEMAGRMIGHSFLRGGASLSVVTLLTGGSTDSNPAGLS